MNKDKVWITSRAGHRGDKTILFNLLTKSPERTYTGIGFTLSPDAQHIAYGVPAGSVGKGQEKVYDSKVAVFIDDIMIYPIIKSGFVINTTFGIPAREDGTTFFHFIKDKETPTSRLSNIQWLDTCSLRFTLHENWVESIQQKVATLEKSVNYEVMNLFHDESSTTTITVNRIDPVH